MRCVVARATIVLNANQQSSDGSDTEGGGAVVDEFSSRL